MLHDIISAFNYATMRLLTSKHFTLINFQLILIQLHKKKHWST